MKSINIKYEFQFNPKGYTKEQVETLNFNYNRAIELAANYFEKNKKENAWLFIEVVNDEFHLKEVEEHQIQCNMYDFKYCFRVERRLKKSKSVIVYDSEDWCEVAKIYW